MKTKLSISFALILLGILCSSARAQSPAHYNVIWNSPSRDHHGSMPTGNGDISLNAWVEGSGDIVFYIGKTDSWDDNGRLLKLGKVRIKLDPAPKTTPFKQVLSLADSTIRVTFGDGTVAKLWVDANAPVVHVDLQSKSPTKAVAQLELWRTTRLQLPTIEVSDPMLDRSKENQMHAPTIVEPDQIITNVPNAIGWYHHNSKSVGPPETGSIQGVAEIRKIDPLLSRTFGALITAKNGRKVSNSQLESVKATNHSFTLFALTEHPSNPKTWLKDLVGLAGKYSQKSHAAHFKKHVQWWSQFWNKSWINATTKEVSPLAPENNFALKVGENQVGGDKFEGEIRNALVPKSFSGPFEISAEIQPKQGAKGRIFDKITPGGADGFLLDLRPGNRIRLIVGNHVIEEPFTADPSRWAQIKLVAGKGEWKVTVDGKTVLSHATNAQTSDEAWYVSQKFALQRYITTCAGRGAYPIKFNGSIFTVPSEGAPGDADYRRWGPGYWWQNTRIPYLSATTNGDSEFLEPLLKMYVDDFLPLNKFRTKKYFGISDAAYYIECVYFWGDVFSESYGWTPQANRKDPLQESGWHKWEWVAGPELVWMMLEVYDHTQDRNLLDKRIIPTANAVINFFDHFYKTDANGKMVMHPSQALETWWDCTNPMPEVAGLTAICQKLLALPSKSVPSESRKLWARFLKKIPPLPIKVMDGMTVFTPADKFAQKSNVENPELYSVFPFRLCSVEKENRKIGIDTFERREDRGNAGWRQDDIFMAYLGLTKQAQSSLISRAHNSDSASRFPAFWGPNYDWTPDQDHGGILMKTMQSMLLQTDGKKIFLLPAWPKAWDVSFKVHAPYKTTVECEFRNGKITKLIVTPSSRKKDVIIRGSVDS